MIDDNYLESEVIINGELKDCDIFPTFSEGVITIYNFDPCRNFNKIKNKGPHFDIYYPEDRLINCFEIRSEGFCEFVQKGPNSGRIADWHGYVAADTGSITREIDEYTMRIYFDEEHIDFLITGRTGYVVPGTVSKELRAKIKELGIYDFSVWFRVPHVKNSKVFSKTLLEKVGLA